MGVEALALWVISAATLLSALIWSVIVILPWRSWSVKQSLDSPVHPLNPDTDLSDVTALIPARNEAAHIKQTLEALLQQGTGLKVVVVNDQSTDDTNAILERCRFPGLQVVQGKPLPDGWSGKLWALQQGLPSVHSTTVLLLDADISLHAGILAALIKKKHTQKLHMISLMARLPMQRFWEKLLLPAFVYFFKQLYPFALTNNNHPRWRKVAAAAGGCILIDKQVLLGINAFDSLRDALIDDCSLARKVKQSGYRIWLGLSHSLDSGRREHSLADIWQMVARTAFTQLHYAWSLLFLVTLIMLVMYLAPLLGVFMGPGLVQTLALLSLLLMFACYMPILLYYQLSPAWSVLMPLIAALYLAMCWSSAIGYARGRRSLWKQRVYTKTLATQPERNAGHSAGQNSGQSK